MVTDDMRWTVASALFTVFLITANVVAEIPNIFNDGGGVSKNESIYPERANDNIIWLPEIQHPIRLESVVDISLSQHSKLEKCSIITPNGQTVPADDVDISGVTIESSSDYVSCRITVGPMSANLLGRWTLCGEYTDQGIIHKRCQPSLISWNNANNPSATWTMTSVPYFHHVVNFGGIRNPVVTISTNIATCHIITPNGEDLVITAASTYPGLQRAAVSQARVCNVTIGPISDAHLGDWVLYGRFGSVTQISREVWFPFTLSLYDEDDPDDQPYNVTLENPSLHTVNLSSSVNVEIVGVGNRLQVDGCEILSASGQRYTNNGISGSEPVNFLNVGSRIACQVAIGPITQDMLGEWVITGRFVNGTHFFERQRIVRILTASTEAITWLPPANQVVLRHSHADVALNRILDQEEKCSFITPGGQTVSFENNTVYGVTVYGSSEFVSCRVRIEAVLDGLRGNWSVCGEYTLDDNTHKRCQRTNVSWTDVNNATSSWELRLQNHFNHPVNYGGFLRPVVVGPAVPVSCHVITPTGEDLVITTSSNYPGVNLTSSGSSRMCNITIGPIHAGLLGNWTLYGKFGTVARITREIRLPMTLFLYDTDNPYSKPYNETNLNPSTSFVGLGGSVHANVSGTGSIDLCEVISPSGKMYTSDVGGDQHVTFLNVGSRIACEVSVGSITPEMFGEWQLLGKFTNRTHAHASRAPFRILEVPVGTEFLPRLQRPTRTGEYIDISLNYNYQEEECSFIDPFGDIFLAADSNEIGVTVHERSDYASCRITVGPMDGSLLGVWSVCGEYKAVDRTYRRCQSVNIIWSNTLNPTNAWQIVNQSHFNHPINFNGVLTPVIVGSNNVISCHIITPKGEDLIITNTTQYPGLTRAVPNNARQCSVAIGPIDATHIGDWVLYGIFGNNNQVNREIRFPMNLFLYNEDDPYKKAYNVSVRDPINRVVNLGTTIFINVTGSGSKDDCEVISPSDQMYTQSGISGTESVTFINTGSSLVCNVSIGPITEDMIGNWLLSGKFSNRNISTEIQIPFTIIKEDPENPIIDNNRDISYLTAQEYVTTIGDNKNVTIATVSGNTLESCHIRLPNGRQYILMNGFNVTGVRILEGRDIACGVNINVLSYQQFGDWVLISREQPRQSNRGIERRLPFAFHGEVYTKAFPQRVTITEGNDLHVRLEHPTDQYNTCKLYGPNENVYKYEVDENQAEICGFTIRSMNKSHSGDWEIKYGKGIVYRALINVNVTAAQMRQEKTVTLTKGTSVMKKIGPKEATYCQIRNPSGRTVFDGFGQCSIVIEKVTREHVGIWKMLVGTKGSLLLTEDEFTVAVSEPEQKTGVTTHVEANKPHVILTCAVPSNYSVSACKFQDPSGRVILANEGIGEDRFIFHGAGFSIYGEEVHECGLRLIDTITEDLGIWRCSVETKQEIFYGFLSVLCPWAMSIPEIAAIVESEPVLTPMIPNTVETVEGEAITMTCSVRSAIHYCYFRARNGTIFNVSPGIPGNIEYVGAGLDAGECGITLKNSAVSDTGNWSCHVGFPDLNEPEQRAFINVTVYESMSVRQYDDNDVLVVEASIYQDRQLEYCRFVRMDGLGFTCATLPDSRYQNYDNLEQGRCVLRIKEPTILENHPWTLTVRIVGQESEISRVTNHTITMPVEPETTLSPLPTTQPTDSSSSTTESTPYHPTTPLPIPEAAEPSYISMWISLTIITILFIILGSMFIPKNNRESVFARITVFRNSIRRSLQKKPLPDLPNAGTENTVSSP